MEMRIVEEVRNRGWPWPKSSWGLGPMFGERGWCTGCGMPLVAQMGPLTLTGDDISGRGQCWIPHWRYEVCVDSELAMAVRSEFGVDHREVVWRDSEGKDPTYQLLSTPTIGPMFDHSALQVALLEHHENAGRACSECGRWKWMPLRSVDLPSVRPEALPLGAHLVASEEWFGDGGLCFREYRFSSDIAELLSASSGGDLRLVDI